MNRKIGELRDIYDKFAFAKIDVPAMINSTVLFLLAWFTVFWLFQFFTVVPAFSIGAKMLVLSSEIDFNSVNTVSSEMDIWNDADNILNIFGTPAIMLFVFIIVSLIFLVKWNTDRLNIRRYLFWLVLCGSIRLCGNYIAGALFGNSFGVWQWNLVTDFLYITTSSFMKYTFVVIMFIVLYFVFKAMSNQIKLLFNPYFANRINNLISSIFFPMLLGLVFIVLYNLPKEPICELTCIVLMFVYVSFVLCKRFVVRYRGIAEEIEAEDEEPINKFPVFLLIILVLAKIFIDMRGGILIASSLYRRFLVENIIMIIVSLILISILVIAVRIYNKRAKRKAKIFLRAYSENKKLMEESLSEQNYQDFGLDSKRKNMDKYLKGWVASLDQTEEAQQEQRQE